MENKLKNAFDRVTMPDKCAKKIEEKLCKPAAEEKGYYAEPFQPAKGGWVRCVAAAAALVVCVVAVGMLLRPDTVLNAADPAETTESYADRREDILEQYCEEQERLKDELGREQERYREELEEKLGEKLEPGYAATVESIKNGLRYPVGSVMYSYTGVESAAIHGMFFDPLRCAMVSHHGAVAEVAGFQTFLYPQIKQFTYRHVVSLGYEFLGFVVLHCLAEHGFRFSLAFGAGELFLNPVAAFIFDVEAVVPLLALFSYRSFCHR